MSVTLSRILLAGDERDALVAALAKVERLEHFTGADVAVIEVIYDYVAEEPVRFETRGERDALIERFTEADRAALNRLVEPFRGRIATLTADVMWSKNTADGVIDRADFLGAELIVKPVTGGDTLVDWIRTPADWSLMREAPCPVLFTKPGDPWDQNRPVLASIDVADPAHAELNRAVLGHGARVAEILNAPLHAVCAFPTLGQSLSEYQVADDFRGMKEDMRATREEALTRLCADLGVTVSRADVVEGHPARAICDEADSVGAQITVLGTSARTGLGKLLIGNTAEQIVHRLNSDVLTVRARASR